VAVRIGFVGGPAAAERLQSELDAAGDTRRIVTLAITPPRHASGVRVPGGWLDRLAPLVAPQRLGLIVVAAGSVAASVVREVAGRTPVADLTEFHEQAFGTVPLAEVDSAWFAALPTRADSALDRAAKRALDIVVAVALLVPAALLTALLALLVRREDGGPAFYRQLRVGQAGRIFGMYKLRTMTVAQPDGGRQWTTAGDERVTSIGRFLRETHLDELPQLFSVLSGTMTLVGPRPEQVGYTDALNGLIPHYARRLDVKPGLTGWAQVRCGYGGSLDGSAYKLCNDLYYLKHRSLTLDLAILLETVRAVALGQQFDHAPANAATLLGDGERRVVPAGASIPAAVAA
jgi:lipopolysaccharide/colanic/teichoic acid biosynthesis glycosyltransferase